jgi:hypothetical protein
MREGGRRKALFLNLSFVFSEDEFLKTKRGTTGKNTNFLKKILSGSLTQLRALSLSLSLSVEMILHLYYQYDYYYYSGD